MLQSRQNTHRTQGHERGTSTTARSRARGGSLARLCLAALPLFGVLACSGGTDRLPPPASGGQGTGGLGGAASGGGGAGGDVGDVCTDGDTRECHVTLGEHNGVLSCFVGIETCVDGDWGVCSEGVVETKEAPLGWKPGLGTKAYSSPAACLNNPCDPTCQIYNEDPPLPLPSDGTPIYDWETGSLDDFPGGLVNKGLKEPCETAADCQFDMYCDTPSSGTCAHDVCQTGAPMANGCSDCVSEICAVDPYCCSYSYTGSCNHDPCVTGSRLNSACDPCVAAICSTPGYGSCCQSSGSWSQTCVNAVTSICGKSCTPPATSWDSICVGEVATVCNAKCADAPCAHPVCYEGAALDASCGSCVDDICAVDPYCCTVGWDNVCVGEVTSICGDACPASPIGQCVPWLPGQTDPNCAGLDITGGPACGGIIPVCNHGNSTAPAGIPIWHYPANAQQMPLCNPNAGHPQRYECFTQEPIPPGHCIEVTGCPNLNGNREIMVNAPGAGQVAECTCENNWTLFSGGSCEPVSCSGSASEATLKKVNMFVTIDISGSMGNTVSGTGLTRWQLVRNAMNTFFQDADSAGLGVALRFWPQTVVSPGGPFSGALSPATAETEANGTTGTADALTAGHSAWTGAISPSSDNDYFVFTVPANTSVTLTTHSVGDMGSCPGDTELWVYNNAGTQIGYVDDSWAGLCSQLTVGPLAAGTYRARVRGYGGSTSIASYQLTLQSGSVAYCNGSQCAASGTITGCGVPRVPLGTLQATAAPADAQEQALVAAMNATNPSGGTPMSVALSGATAWAVDYKANNPNEETFVVLITDGQPTECDTNVTNIANIAGNAFTNGQVRTHVIGIVGVSQATIDAIALAGGGQSYFVDNSPLAQQQLADAMNAIKGDPVSCDLDLPPANTVDLANVDVNYTSSAGTTTTLGQVANLADCASNPNGWYFDDNQSPTQVSLCPTICDAAKGDSGASISVALGCPLSYSPTVHTEVYEADCPAGKQVQWGFFAWDTTTGSNSNVSFAARTSATLTFTDPFTPLGTAKAIPLPDTQDCLMSGPSPCPVDLFSTLGSIKARRDNLELQITLNPSGDTLTAPLVHDWAITYSCPDSE